MDDSILIGRNAVPIEQLNEWMVACGTKKKVMIFIIDEDNVVLKKIDSDKVIHLDDKRRMKK